MCPPRITLVQLPVPQPAALAPTGNVPLAAGSLAVAAAASDELRGAVIDVVSPALTDRCGDARLADEIVRREPDVLGISLYLWNTERSLDLARAVKRRRPSTRIVIGGPEVGPDNPFVMNNDGFDVAVTGESEPVFAPLMSRILAGTALDDLPGVSVRAHGRMSPFTKEVRADFPLARYPSPYLAGMIPVESDRAVYVETVRGCRSHCTFCFYPRSSGVLRTLDIPASARLVADLAERGAREIVFLDPTFNHRPGFEELVAALADVNHDHRLSFFAEVRAEGLTAAHAQAMARAGFTKLEVGLQSVSPETLKRTKRFGSAALVGTAARMMHDAGIKLLVDLIIGLPGDTADDVRRGIDFLIEHGLGDEAQIFPLSVLPGTAMRSDAVAEGLTFDPAPPYRIRGTSLLTGDVMRDLLFEAEERLGRRLDEEPRPHLVEADPAADPPDVFDVDVDHPTAAMLTRAARPGAQFAALWFHGQDLFARRDVILAAIAARLAVDPHARLDVVLVPGQAFPFDLIEAVRAVFAQAPASYLTRSLAHRGEDAQHLISVVLPADVRVARDWGAAVMTEIPIFREQGLGEAADSAGDLGDLRPGARIVGAPANATISSAWHRLTDAARHDAVVFADRSLERAWLSVAVGIAEPRA